MYKYRGRLLCLWTDGKKQLVFTIISSKHCCHSVSHGEVCQVGWWVKAASFITAAPRWTLLWREHYRSWSVATPPFPTIGFIHHGKSKILLAWSHSWLRTAPHQLCHQLGLQHNLHLWSYLDDTCPEDILLGIWPSQKIMYPVCQLTANRPISSVPFWWTPTSNNFLVSVCTGVQELCLITPPGMIIFKHGGVMRPDLLIFVMEVVSSK